MKTTLDLTHIINSNELDTFYNLLQNRLQCHCYRNVSGGDWLKYTSNDEGSFYCYRPNNNNIIEIYNYNEFQIEMINEVFELLK